MESVTANLDGEVRRDTLNGVEYLVAPASMLVPGVLNGSKGPLFYPHDEVNSNVEDWNGKPIVVYHPKKGINFVSACDPEVIQRQGIGNVWRAYFGAGNRPDGKSKLRAEAWFNIELTRKADESLPGQYKILPRLEAGKPIELSTGLYTVNDDTPGVHNGIAYDSIARGYKPDHLAVLPDQVGACSINDGCGFLVNANDEAITSIEPSIQRDGLWQAIESFSGWDKLQDVANVFCATGKGGGVDPKCSPGEALKRYPYGMSVGKIAEVTGLSQKKVRAELQKLGAKEISKDVFIHPDRLTSKAPTVAPVTAPVTSREVPHSVVTDAIKKNDSSGSNLVPLTKVREHLAEHGAISREHQDNSIIAARQAGKISLVPIEGRHGITEEQKRDSIPDVGYGYTARLGYASIRNSGAQTVPTPATADDTVKNAAQPSSSLDMTPDKACKILKDGEVHGHPLTDAQRGMFGALCGERDKSGTNNTDYEDVLPISVKVDSTGRMSVANKDYLLLSKLHGLLYRPGSVTQVEDANNGVVIYTQNNTVWKHTYALDQQGNVILGTEAPTEVKKIDGYYRRPKQSSASPASPEVPSQSQGDQVPASGTPTSATNNARQQLILNKWSQAARLAAVASREAKAMTHRELQGASGQGSAPASPMMQQASRATYYANQAMSAVDGSQIVASHDAAARLHRILSAAHAAKGQGKASKSHALAALLHARASKKRAMGESSGSPTGNQGASMPQTRDQLIGWLTTNCECWKKAEDKKLLDNFSDDKLLKLKEAYEKASKFDLANNQTQEPMVTLNHLGQLCLNGDQPKKAQTDGVDLVKLGKVLGVDIKPGKDPKGFVDALSMKLGVVSDQLSGAVIDDTEDYTDLGADEATEGPTVPAGSTSGGSQMVPATNKGGKPVKSITEQEWLAQAPPSIREVLTNAKQVVDNEKKAIAIKLTANIKDGTKRKERFDKYMTKSLDELRETLLAVNDVIGNGSGQQQMPSGYVPPSRLRHGQSAPVKPKGKKNQVNNSAPDDDDDDVDEPDVDNDAVSQGHDLGPVSSDYSGAAGGPRITGNRRDQFDETDELLDVPTMNSYPDDDDEVPTRSNGKRRNNR